MLPLWTVRCSIRNCWLFHTIITKIRRKNPMELFWFGTRSLRKLLLSKHLVLIYLLLKFLLNCLLLFFRYIFYCQSRVLSLTWAKFHPNLLLGGTYSGQICLWDNRQNKRTPVQKSPLSSSAHTHPVYCLKVVGTKINFDYYFIIIFFTKVLVLFVLFVCLFRNTKRA